MFSYRVLCVVLYAAFASAFVAFPASLSSAEEKPKPQVLFTDVNIFDGV